MTTQTAAEAERPPSCQTLQTPSDLVAWLRRQPIPRRTEWYLALCLGEAGALRGQFTLFDGHTCRVNAEPAFGPLLQHATALEARYLVLVRQHDHRWMGPSAEGLRQLDALQARGAAQGVQLLAQLTLDTTETIYTVIFQPLLGPGGTRGAELESSCAR